MKSHPCPADWRIMMLGPHPDDFDSIGVTMRILHQQGNQLYVAIINTASGVEDSFCSPPSPATKISLRKKEQEESCRLFGLHQDNLTFLTMDQGDDEQVIETESNLIQLQKLIEQQNPDAIFLPHGNDTNSAHRAVYSMTKKILSLHTEKPVTLFMNQDPKTIDIRPDVFTPYETDEAEWKAALLRCHKSQQQRNLNTRGYGFDKRILDADHSAAQNLNIESPYAEVFELEICNKLH